MFTKNFRLRCDYCDEIIESEEFNNGTAINIHHSKYDWFYEGEFEDIETCHVACREKDRRCR